MIRSNFFVTGGALLADASSYVARAADTDLLQALKANEFCYVLTTRQMGKTSLTVRTAAQLRDNGWSVVVLDLTAFGQNLDVEQWYFSMLSEVAMRLNLEDEMEAYWEEHSRRAPLHRFMGAIREIYLERKRKPLAVFVDEIDVVRSLQFKADEFFAGIRECYHRRSEDARLRRLTFCLLGVATPSDLIADSQMTPFNIGRAIELADFTRDEATVLAAGLSPYRESAIELLDRVLWWTGGHPYLTQRLCAEVSKSSINSPKGVDAVCDAIFLSADARSRDENLQFVRDRLLRTQPDPSALLDAYARICRGEKLTYDDHNPLHAELRLAGIIRVTDGHLEPRNRIYSRVFDLKWVHESLPDAESRRQRAAYWRGVRRVTGAALAILAVMGGLVFQVKRSAEDAKAAHDRARVANEQARELGERQLERDKLRVKEAQEQAERDRQQAAKLKTAAEETKVAAELVREANQREREANRREREANEQQRQQAERTEAALKRLVDTQAKVATLLEVVTPFVGPKSGKSILDRAEDLVAGLSSEAGDDPRIRLGLVGLRRVCGRLYLRLGNEVKALEQAEAAQTLVRGELARKPGQEPTGWQRDDNALKKLLFECQILFGDVLLAGRVPEAPKVKTAEDYDRAMKVYRDATQLARTEQTAHLEDAKWRELYFSGLLTIGDTAALFGRNEDAEKRFAEAVEEAHTLRDKRPDATELAWTEASFHDRLGTLHLNRDALEKAREEFDLALKLREEGTADSATENPEQLSDIAQSYNKLGRLAFNANKFSDALAYHERGLTIRRKLREQSSRLDWARNLGFSLYNYFQTLWKLNRNQEALKIAEERKRLAEDLFNQDRSDANLKYDFGNALFAYGDILLNVNDPALQDWARALDISKDAVERTERKDARLLALLAQALRLNNYGAEAHAVAEEASQLLPPEDKRSREDVDTAKEIAYELGKSKGSTAKGPAVAAEPLRKGRKRR